MKKVVCYVDFYLRGVGVQERTEAFMQLCNFLMLLRVWDITELRCTQSGKTRSWSIDWSKVVKSTNGSKQAL